MHERDRARSLSLSLSLSLSFVGTCTHLWLTARSAVAFVLIFENALCALKVLLAYMIPDVPKFVSNSHSARLNRRFALCP
jgi:hypothetical protein